MNAEQTAQRELGKTIVRGIIDDTIANLHAGKYPNALRGINQAATAIKQTLRDEGLEPRDFIMAGTIGDIDMRLPIRDPLERARFGHLEAEMGLDPKSETFRQAQEEERNILTKYQEGAGSIFGYDGDARGTQESRNIFRKEAEGLGLATESSGNVWLGEGGMGILTRAFRTLGNAYRRDGKNALMLSPSVCFSMATNSAKDNGLDVAYVETSDTKHQLVNARSVERYFAEGGRIPDVMLLTPAENPAARSHEPETMRGVITALQEKNPQITFIFDMAYMSMIPNERAQEIMQVINETGAAQQAIFSFSQSKRLGEPRLRVGAAIINNKDLGVLYQNDTIRNMSSFSWKPDVWYQVLNRIVTPETLEQFNSLLRLRQQTLLQVLRDLDPGGNYFSDLDTIAIPGFEKANPDAVLQDNPLYLYVQLKDGVSALEHVAKDWGIFGIPGNVFGDSRNHMRFSLGVVSLSEILGRSPNSKLPAIA